MENVTIGQVVIAIGSLSTLAGFFYAIYNFIKKTVLDKISDNTYRIEKLEKETVNLEREVANSKEERLILLKAQLACLKGLKEQGCDGPVTQAIGDIENYLIKKTHN